MNTESCDLYLVLLKGEASASSVVVWDTLQGKGRSREEKLQPRK